MINCDGVDDDNDNELAGNHKRKAWPASVWFPEVQPNWWCISKGKHHPHHHRHYPPHHHPGGQVHWEEGRRGEVPPAARNLLHSERPASGRPGSGLSIGMQLNGNRCNQTMFVDLKILLAFFQTSESKAVEWESKKTPPRWNGFFSFQPNTQFPSLQYFQTLSMTGQIG